MNGRIGGVGFVILSVAYGLAARDIEFLPVDAHEVMSARTLPYALSAAGTLLGVLMVLLPVRQPPAALQVGGWIAALALLAGVVGYALVLPWLGFPLSTSLFLLAGFRLLGERRAWVLSVASLLPVAALWAVLTLGLGVYLAPGRLTGL